MEMEPTPPVTTKKLWNIARIVFYMLGRSISKSKLMVDLHMMVKRGKIAGKAITNLMLHHHYSAAFSCRSSNSVHFVSPGEYEFSCSNSPVYPSYYTKRKHHHHRRRNHADDHDHINVVQKVFEILNNEIPEASPMAALPGFGRTPLVRQLRVTDSPFPLKDVEEDTQVDKAADEFIRKFYKELKQQKKTAALESPSPYHNWAR
uniref:Avr9/Cf-9 rapidly elicited protein n=1 Tax=Davidia involucrata TaxID=16924 RepID=A0A5B7BPY0_DAVIN